MGIPVFSHILSITIKLDNNTNLNSVSKGKKTHFIQFYNLLKTLNWASVMLSFALLFEYTNGMYNTSD